MNTKWCLLKTSDGQRGVAGKKKVYEVRLETNGHWTLVRCEWGMAEKADRRSSVAQFGSEQAARRFAIEKVGSKMDKGYNLAYAV